MTTATRHRLECRLVDALVALVRVLPTRVVCGLGGSLGRAFYVCHRARRRIANDNLAHAFPEKTPAERRAIARDAFAHFGRMLLDLLKIASLSDEAMMGRVVIEGEERSRRAYARGKGVIFITGHFGFWELQAIVHGLRVQPVGVLARTLDNPSLNARLEAIRQRTGNIVIYRDGTLRRVMRLLHDGRGVAVLIDQHVHGLDAVAVDFFGRPAATTSLVAGLALRTGATVLPVFAVPEGCGRYRLVVEEPIDPPDATVDDPVRVFTQRCTDVLEGYVRRYPSCWLWMHRRWRSTDSSPRS